MWRPRAAPCCFVYGVRVRVVCGAPEAAEGAPLTAQDAICVAPLLNTETSSASLQLSQLAAGHQATGSRRSDRSSPSALTSPHSLRVDVKNGLRQSPKRTIDVLGSGESNDTAAYCPVSVLHHTGLH